MKATYLQFMSNRMVLVLFSILTFLMFFLIHPVLFGMIDQKRELAGYGDPIQFFSVEFNRGNSPQYGQPQFAGKPMSPGFMDPRMRPQMPPPPPPWSLPNPALQSRPEIQQPWERIPMRRPESRQRESSYPRPPSVTNNNIYVVPRGHRVIIREYEDAKPSRQSEQTRTEGPIVSRPDYTPTPATSNDGPMRRRRYRVEQPKVTSSPEVTPSFPSGRFQRREVREATAPKRRERSVVASRPAAETNQPMHIQPDSRDESLDSYRPSYDSDKLAAEKARLYKRVHEVFDPIKRKFDQPSITRHTYEDWNKKVPLTGEDSNTVDKKRSKPRKRKPLKKIIPTVEKPVCPPAPSPIEKLTKDVGKATEKAKDCFDFDGLKTVFDNIKNQSDKSNPKQYTLDVLVPLALVAEAYAGIPYRIALSQFIHESGSFKGGQSNWDERKGLPRFLGGMRHYNGIQHGLKAFPVYIAESPEAAGLKKHGKTYKNSEGKIVGFREQTFAPGKVFSGKAIRTPKGEYYTSWDSPFVGALMYAENIKNSGKYKDAMSSIQSGKSEERILKDICKVYNLNPEYITKVKSVMGSYTTDGQKEKYLQRIKSMLGGKPLCNEGDALSKRLFDYFNQ